jgi:maltose O-acetyltransferase
MTEKEKMLAGQLYRASDPILTEDRQKARSIFRKINKMNEDEKEEQNKLFYELFGKTGKDLMIEPPFYCDYGYNISLGENVFINFNCCILDVAEVRIGNNVLIAPYVQIYTATHPQEAKLRKNMLEYARPVTIGDDVWIGGGVIICPGVSIGIGAGSVVTKNVPDNVLIAGNPAKELKKINSPDRKSE